MGNLLTASSNNSIYKSIMKLFKTEVRVIINGLDAAGKTTILYRMALGEVVTTIPTIGFNVETVQYKNFSFICWDIGGRDKMRALVRHYYENTKVMLFVVDSNDRDRIGEVKELLAAQLNEDILRDTIFLIFANKQDLPNSMTVDEVADCLNLNEIKKTHRTHIVGTVATTLEGINEGFDWLTTQLAYDQFKSPIVETANDLKSAANTSQNYFTDYFNKLTSYFTNTSPIIQTAKTIS